uniref:Isoform 2 of Trihelix transcription factor GTL1 n=1 Tax=Arabidopsis thaliana TaxID=3702 RepID=Q9C882-2|nr:DNA-binding factor, putative [Arabidopsis thaliana]AAP68263.1 At1g33240 [Arabidopsis thaliana]
MEQGGGGGGNEVVEEASPISSRPPANNLEELMRFSAAADDGGLGGGGGGGGGGSASSSSGNRWPREETLALLRIRSDMDSTFRDATLKAPLWEHVSRKLLELGYKRSSKKCKEKFENVQKYYKRTKETRGGRHDGKAYKFFSQLEALNTTPPSHPHAHQPEQKQQQQPQQEMVMSSEQSSLPSSSRWPKAEILALINLRSGMEPRYQDNVPKGLLWEEISTSMKRMGYNRNAKRCKEKWENINKYYKKVKESNKKRPQDAKTCPYFHRLDLLYRNKVLGSGGGSSTSGLPQDQKQSPVTAMKPPQEGLVNVQQTHGSASTEEEEPIEESPQGTEKKTL